MKKNFIYQGLGFPVHLTQVETEIIDGEELPRINHRRLEERVFAQLTLTPERLTGIQLAWVRSYLGFSQAELAKKLAFSSHATISSWESQGKKASGMDARTEYCLRIEMCRYAAIEGEVLFKLMPDFMNMRKHIEVVKVKTAT